jgi:hypothetical protein
MEKGKREVWKPHPCSCDRIFIFRKFGDHLNNRNREFSIIVSRPGTNEILLGSQIDHNMPWI